MGYLKNEFAAKDLVQDVAIKVWEERREWEQIENFPAWCMRIARNRCLDLLKKEKRTILSISNNYDTTDDSPNPQEVLEGKDSNHQIKKLISCIEEPQRTILMLREMELNTYKEIAEVMNLSIEQVKVNIYRGRQKLKKILENKSKNDN